MGEQATHLVPIVLAEHHVVAGVLAPTAEQEGTQGQLSSICLPQRVALAAAAALAASPARSMAPAQDPSLCMH